MKLQYRRKTDASDLSVGLLVGTSAYEVANRLTSLGVPSYVLMQAISSTARDCTVSKEFRLKRSQVLAGSLRDPNGASLPRIGLELLSGGTVIRDLRTNSEGAYDFGEVPSGKYRLRIHYGDDAFCPPRVRCE